jgi:hypothetical protein
MQRLPPGNWALLSKTQLARIRTLSERPRIVGAANTLPALTSDEAKTKAPGRLTQTWPPPRDPHPLPGIYESKIPRRPPLPQSQLEKNDRLKHNILTHRFALRQLQSEAPTFSRLYDDPEFNGCRERILELGKKAEELKYQRAEERFEMQMQAAEIFQAHRKRFAPLLPNKPTVKRKRPAIR